MTGRVLIVDGIATNRILLKARLAAACYEPISAEDAESALRLARQAGPEAIVVDLDGEGGAVAQVATPCAGGVETLRRLRAAAELTAVPLLALSGAGNAAQRVAALDAGADDVLAKPVDEAALLARLRSLLRARAALAELGDGSPGAHQAGLAEAGAPFLHQAADAPSVDALVAIVADRGEQGSRLRRRLAGLIPQRLVLRDRAAALAEPGLADPPDLYLIDAQAGGPGGGLRLLSELRSRGEARHARLGLLRQAAAAESDAIAFDLGADDLIDPEGDPAEVALRIATQLRRKAAEDRLRSALRDRLRLAVIDPLTGLHNRRYALSALAGMAAAARLEGGSVGVMVIDLDRFKSVNDRWGHAAGDAVLAETAARLSRAAGPGDLVARIGGEEFLVALPGADAQAAMAAAARLSAVIDGAPVALTGGGGTSVTASIGVALLAGDDLARRDAIAAAIDRADSALMQAKAAGRHRATLYAGATRRAGDRAGIA
jgi:two-component system cell cycle response regulator